jgi:hypothetical protein
VFFHNRLLLSLEYIEQSILTRRVTVIVDVISGLGQVDHSSCCTLLPDVKPIDTFMPIWLWSFDKPLARAHVVLVHHSTHGQEGDAAASRPQYLKRLCHRNRSQLKTVI